jgi:hypothetical protein
MDWEIHQEMVYHQHKLLSKEKNLGKMKYYFGIYFILFILFLLILVFIVLHNIRMNEIENQSLFGKYF